MKRFVAQVDEFLSGSKTDIKTGCFATNSGHPARRRNVQPKSKMSNWSQRDRTQSLAKNLDIENLQAETCPSNSPGDGASVRLFDHRDPYVLA